MGKGSVGDGRGTGLSEMSDNSLKPFLKVSCDDPPTFHAFLWESLVPYRHIDRPRVLT